VDLVPDPLLHRKPGSTVNGNRTSGSVAKNSDHYIVEEVGAELQIVLVSRKRGSIYPLPHTSS
jgi:hypothetical protein